MDGGASAESLLYLCSFQAAFSLSVRAPHCHFVVLQRGDEC